jgi:four helix bundle protein
MGSGSSTAGLAQENIRERSFSYALRAIRLYLHIEARRHGAAKILGRQYLRAASSLGANFEEAQPAERCADFIHKLSIAQKEARESSFSLRLLAESGLLPRAG